MDPRHAPDTEITIAQEIAPVGGIVALARNLPVVFADRAVRAHAKTQSAERGILAERSADGAVIVEDYSFRLVEESLGTRCKRNMRILLPVY
jgi:hypothetical protein